MYQSPLLGSGHTAPKQGAAAGRAAADNGVAGLAPSEDGAEAGFPGEMQAMLMQLSPQQAQRLNELVAGGMTLPQAASSLLGGSPGGAIGEVFAQLLEDGLALSGEHAAAGGPTRLAERAALQQLMGKLAARGDGVADLAQVLSASTAAAPLAAPATPGPYLSPQLTANLLDMGVPQQVGGKGWGSAIADRVMWMVQGEQQFAKLRLNPPNLGPLEVRVMVHQDQTSVSFLAHQAAVREALEAALPRLREMFDQQSMQLVRADVSDPGAQQQDAPGDTPQQPTSGPAEPDGEPGQGASVHAMPVAAGVADGLIDLFA